MRGGSYRQAKRWWKRYREVEALRRDFLPAHLRPLLGEAGIDRAVVVQAHQSLAEARWLLDLAATNDILAGVVAWVDLTDSNLARDLDELQRNSKFKGVHHLLQDEPDDAWMLRKDVVEGFRELERRDMPYDVLIYPRHLKNVPKLREHCPKLRLVIDHLAKPPIAQHEIEAWARDMETVASLPQVWRDALETQAVADAVLESARTEKWVAPESVVTEDSKSGKAG